MPDVIVVESGSDDRRPAETVRLPGDEPKPPEVTEHEPLHDPATYQPEPPKNDEPDDEGPWGPM